MADITLHNATLNGKRIAFSSDTQFLVQTGKGPKGSYTKTVVFKGNLAGAVAHYNGINLGRGYKKRLLMPSSPRNGGVLAREFSFPTGPRNLAPECW